MSIERLHHPAVNLLCGQGLDLPHQAARCRARWLPVREGRAPALLIALLWARECTDLVRDVEVTLETILADCCSTPAAWTEAQALRQVLAGLNLHLFRQRQQGLPIPELNAGLLLVQGAQVQLQRGELVAGHVVQFAREAKALVAARGFLEQALRGLQLGIDRSQLLVQ